MNGIYNAKIDNWAIKRNTNIMGDPVELGITIKSTEGSAYLTVPIKKITKLFNVLEINDIKSLINAPCIVLIDNQIMRTIGNFLFVDVEDIYTDKDKVDSINSKEWLDYDIYVKWKEKHIL